MNWDKPASEQTVPSDLIMIPAPTMPNRSLYWKDVNAKIMSIIVWYTLGHFREVSFGVPREKDLGQIGLCLSWFRVTIKLVDTDHLALAIGCSTECSLTIKSSLIHIQLLFGAPWLCVTLVERGSMVSRYFLSFKAHLKGGWQCLDGVNKFHSLPGISR